MLARLTFAHCLVIGGAVLGVLGLILFWALPIAESLPPFLITALLAIGCGVFDLRRARGS
jgi:hypothetical protein